MPNKNSKEVCQQKSLVFWPLQMFQEATLLSMLEKATERDVLFQ
ncbi:hypothetical protein NC653_011725 [Populus alba x Populus x berolinensis]|uniref:Uncharacterized protein n=2 Tax=Populus alba x Populus x berolinensis TaxID=444605 RepID=A0AAD6W6T4_9ROSI|nr:hypothetical protein NC653_011725 [Populus alba x Populus x berolinensis]